jgi:hypothetical protein
MPIQQITSGIIANNTVIAADIADGSITAAKLAAGAGGQFIDTQTPRVFYYNAQNVTSNISVSANQNSFAAGPITIDDPFSVTLNAGSTLVIL